GSRRRHRRSRRLPGQTHHAPEVEQTDGATPSRANTQSSRRQWRRSSPRTRNRSSNKNSAAGGSRGAAHVPAEIWLAPPPYRETRSGTARQNRRQLEIQGTIAAPDVEFGFHVKEHDRMIHANRDNNAQDHRQFLPPPH